MAFPSLIGVLRRRPNTDLRPTMSIGAFGAGVASASSIDPGAHRGLTQHAFLVGYDRIALCGYRPVGRRDGSAVPLAAATPVATRCARPVPARFVHPSRVIDPSTWRWRPNPFDPW